MISKGLSYGWLAARRRVREMVLPAITTATGAFLVVLVFGMSEGIRAQSASLGHADEIARAVVLIAVTVLLVGVAEVAVATTRTVAHRTRELGVLGANGVPRRPVVAALLVEPVDRGGTRRAARCRARCHHRDRPRCSGLRRHRVVLRGSGLRRRDRDRRQHRGRAGHQHRADVESGVAVPHPIPGIRRLTADDRTRRNSRRPRLPSTPRWRRSRSSRSATSGSCTSSAMRSSRR